MIRQLALALILLPLAARAELPSASCRPAPAATLAVVPAAGGLLLVPVSIGGADMLAEIDTGSDLSLLDPAMTRRLGLPVMRAFTPLLAGADGRPLTDFVAVHSVSVAGLQPVPARFVVPPAWQVVDRRATAMLGGDLLRSWDVELDLGGGRVTLYPRTHCLEVTPPFEPGFEVVSIDALLGHVVVPVRLNGESLRALLDTGATASSMSLASARRHFGLRPGLGGVTASGTTITTDGGRLASWSYRFRMLEIGRTRIAYPALDLIDQPSGVRSIADHDIVLGLSEIRRLRLYIAYGASKLAIARAGV